MPAPAFHIWQNDTSPSIGWVPGDLGGLDPTAATISFIMIAQDGTEKVNAAASWDAGLGAFVYAWTTGDTDTAGAYRARFRADFGGGEIETFPAAAEGPIPVAVM